MSRMCRHLQFLRIQREDRIRARRLPGTGVRCRSERQESRAGYLLGRERLPEPGQRLRPAGLYRRFLDQEALYRHLEALRDGSLILRNWRAWLPPSSWFLCMTGEAKRWGTVPVLWLEKRATYWLIIMWPPAEDSIRSVLRTMRRTTGRTRSSNTIPCWIWRWSVSTGGCVRFRSTAAYANWSGDRK